jgi:lipopolysaccharide/colanic/teichoic acid biosynthesis glycosyltransferase
MLFRERKRSERSGRGFGLMLLDSPSLFGPGDHRNAVEKVLGAISRCARDTDIVGWYREDSTIGIVFTELGADSRSVASALLSKATTALSGALDAHEVDEIKVSLRLFPDDWGQGGGDVDPSIYDNLYHKKAPDRISRIVKRSVDIAGSLLAILIDLPVFLGIALAIKLTSRGPVLFRQKRVGQFGKEFTFLKFRSMYCNTDQRVHQEYVERLIANGGASGQGKSGQTQFKMADDPRVTRIGRLLRKTSLDELPQFINILKGDMSLVGPRPPLPYEVACYQTWHWARLLAAKPGLTGLWQVDGRSRVKFDDMVRMDLRYASEQSLRVDLTLMLRTPLAVISGNGAC